MEITGGWGETLNLLEIEIKRISLKLLSICDRRVTRYRGHQKGRGMLNSLWGEEVSFTSFNLDLTPASSCLQTSPW